MSTDLVPLAQLFTGGLNRAVSPSELQPDASPETRDARLVDRMPGRLGPRLGRTRVTTGTYTYLGLGMLVAPFGRFKILADTNGDWTASAVTWAEVTPASPTTASVTGMNTAEQVRFLQYKNRIYAFNGKNRPRCFDGNRWTTMGILGGIDLPQFTPSITLGGGLVQPVTTGERTGTTVTLTTSSAHGLSVGQTITVLVNDGAFNGTFTIATVPTTTTLTYATAASGTISSKSLVGSITSPVATTIQAATLAVATNVATVTTTTAHGFSAGQVVTFTGDAKILLDSPLGQGPFTLLSASGSTMTFPLTTSDFSSFSLTGAQQYTYVAISGATGASAGLSGTYYYFVVPACSTKLDANGRMIEGIPSAVSAVASPVNQSVTIGNIPATHTDITSGGAGVDRWNIYRTTNGGFDSGVSVVDQDFYYLGYVSLGTTTYPDTKADSTDWYKSGTNFNRMRFNQNIPPTFRFAAVYGERIFGAGFEPITAGNATVSSGSASVTLSTAAPDGIKGCWIRFNGENPVYTIKSGSGTSVTLDRVKSGSTVTNGGYTIYRPAWELYFSEYMDPEAWGPDGEGLRNKVEVPGHQAITGLCAFSDHLLVFTATEIYVVTGKGPNRTDVRMLPEPFFSGLGAVSCDAIVRVDNECHFLSKDGPAMIASGGPELYGIALNTDWLDGLGATELRLATAGTDGRDVYWSVPSGSGQTLNSKTWRYARDTKSWWEEVGLCPTRFVRQDGTDGQIQVLFYLQGRFVNRVAYGTTDLSTQAYIDSFGTSLTRTLTHITIVSNVVQLSTSTDHFISVGDVVTVSGVSAFGVPDGNYTVTVVPGTQDFKFNRTASDVDDDTSGSVTIYSYGSTSSIKVDGAFPTTDGGLEQCLVRFYTSAGVLAGTRRIISNTASTLTWSTTSTLPYSGALTIQPSYTYEIGNVTWDWVTRSLEVPGRLARVQEVHVAFDTKQGNSVSMWKSDLIDMVESGYTHKVCEGQKATKWMANRASREYACRVGSRTGGIINNVTAETIVEADVK